MDADIAIVGQYGVTRGRLRLNAIAISQRSYYAYSEKGRVKSD